MIIQKFPLYALFQQNMASCFAFPHTRFVFLLCKFRLVPENRIKAQKDGKRFHKVAVYLLSRSL